MPLDHSITYRDHKVRNLPHRMRLKKIISILEDMKLGDRYCDIGCSNGYLTNLISKKFCISNATGLDYNFENIAIAKQKYSNIKFDIVDLNIVNNSRKKYDLVTCFETLEHDGNPYNAIENMLHLIDTGGIILISVPNEVGCIGLVKFLIKTILFRYNLCELNKKGAKIFYLSYLFSLINNERISKFRNKRDGYGTHFGFDYRDISDWLKKKNITYSLHKKGTTVFYVIEC